MIEKKYVTYEDIHYYIDKLCEHLEKINYKPTGVYGIPRGGLIYAVILSYKLDIPMLLAPAKGCIIIDDIADTGKTLLHYTINETQYNEYFITTMFYKKSSAVKPNFYLYEKNEDWIVYPYESVDEEFDKNVEKNYKK